MRQENKNRTGKKLKKAKKFKCKQCGKCCIVWFNNGCCVTLSDKEIEAKKHFTGTMYDDIIVLRKKTVYILALGRKASCCVYLDVKTMKCKIFAKDKLWVCKMYSCKGTQEFAKWTLLKSGKLYKFK